MSTHSLRARPLPAGPASLRASLKLDAVVTGANGAAYLAAAGPLEDLLGLPASALRAIGAFLLLFAVGVWLLGARERPSRGLVREVVAVNAAWALGSLAVAGLAVGSPTTAGTVWIVAQAGVVGAFAFLQRRAAAGATPA